jgi:hypothetical protein
MADTRDIVTIETAIEHGGCHTKGLKVSAGTPILEAIQQAGYHIETMLDILWPMAMNCSASDESLYPAVVPAAIARALISSVSEAIEKAEREVRDV